MTPLSKALADISNAGQIAVAEKDAPRADLLRACYRQVRAAATPAQAVQAINSVREACYWDNIISCLLDRAIQSLAE